CAGNVEALGTRLGAFGVAAHEGDDVEAGGAHGPNVGEAAEARADHGDAYAAHDSISTSRRRCTWLVGDVRGMASSTARRRGCLWAARRPSQWARRFSSVGGADVAPAETTTAQTTSPHSTSGSPTTATSATPGYDARAVSTSAGATVSPPVRMTSRARPTIERYPSASNSARSPVRSQPSTTASAVATGSS